MILLVTLSHVYLPPLAVIKMVHAPDRYDGPFSYSGKNQNRTIFLLHSVEFSNVHNSGRRPNATQSSHAYKNV